MTIREFIIRYGAEIDPRRYQIEERRYHRDEAVVVNPDIMPSRYSREDQICVGLDYSGWISRGQNDASVTGLEQHGVGFLRDFQKSLSSTVEQILDIADALVFETVEENYKLYQVVTISIKEVEDIMGETGQ